MIIVLVVVLQRTNQCEPWYWLLKNFFEVYLLHFTAKHRLQHAATTKAQEEVHEGSTVPI